MTAGALRRHEFPPSGGHWIRSFRKTCPVTGKAQFRGKGLVSLRLEARPQSVSRPDGTRYTSRKKAYRLAERLVTKKLQTCWRG